MKKWYSFCGDYDEKTNQVILRHEYLGFLMTQDVL